MKVAIVNYGMGNLASVSRALETLGHEPFVTDAPDAIQNTARLILPGVGAFGEAMARLRETGWIGALKNYAAHDHTRLLGICLGMQLLAARGTEHGEHDGLGMIDGTILNLRDIGVTDRVPHVGWNQITIDREDLLLDGIPEGTDFYFVHSFGFVPEQREHRIAGTPYGTDVTAIVRRGNIWGTQFHPEKSSKAGMRLLLNFLERM